ncbi:hypothetical protein SLEP1_g13922 [Rubroshorea leprosula]|uniref:Uncharacterized protein n=1 Tax=Rubroshorea leprosula TaxID=152421 RepID=A0AAV5IRW5_9ROSI|nr:hypothetical protein SLEP1_g13922 [Rubroshorea leprosula]
MTLKALEEMLGGPRGSGLSKVNEDWRKEIYGPAECVDSVCPSATAAQYAVFFLGLYLIALGTGGIKPCVSSFGADQFDDTDPKERVKKGSFFNWFYFSINIGSLISSSVLVWIQDNVGWGLGFGIPALFMGIAIASFFSGTKLYRFQRPGGSPITRMCQVLVASFHKRNLEVPTNSTLLYETHDKHSAIEGSRKLEHTEEFKCLDKAAILSDAELTSGEFSNPWRVCTVTQVEEFKILIRMLPIWATGIIFSAVYAQMSTLFVEQGMMMDTSIEIKRLQLARELGLVDKDVAVPMSIFWQIPQYFLLGAAEVFTYIGQLEFFYDQSPDAMRSLCSALSLLTYCLGNYLSSLILTLVTYFTTLGGKTGWIPDNLNEGHLDYFFWLLAGLSFLNLLVYVFCAKKYKQKKAS